MHVSRIDSALIDPGRLDADFYYPEYLAIEALIKRRRYTRLSECGRFFAGPFGSKLPNSIYLKKGVPLFRVGNVGKCELVLDNMAHIDERTHRDLKASEVVPGDLLIVKASVGEKVCRVPHWMARANITQHIIGVRPNEKYDIDYVSAFLLAKYGRKQLERYSLGSIIQYLGINDARSILIPLVEPEVQAYIGEKIRLVGLFREKAEVCKRAALLVFEGDISWSSELLDVAAYGRIRSSELGPRLDYRFNSLKRIAVERHFERSLVTTNQLADIAFISGMIGWKGLTTDYYVEKGPWLLRGVEVVDGVIQTDDLVCVDESKYLEQPQIHLVEGDVALTKDGSLGKAVVIPKLPNRLAAGSTVARVRKKDETDIGAYYLEFALNHACVHEQIESYATGVAQPHVTQEWIGVLKIPRSQREKEIEALWKLHHEYRYYSNKLVDVAKKIVEAMIDGKISECDISTAIRFQESADRAIISRLKIGGIDGAGEAVISDADRLYELVEQATRELEA